MEVPKECIMSRYFFTMALLMIAGFSFGQYNETLEGPVSKLFYAELGGPGILFSANFDGRFKPGSRLGWGFRAGLGFTLVDDPNPIINQPGGSFSNYRTRSVATIPVGVNYLFGKPNTAHIFEVGAGATVLSRKSSILNYNYYKEGNVLGHFEFMYRRQPIDGGFSWRIGFTPIINPDGDIFPFGAVGLGFAFK